MRLSNQTTLARLTLIGTVLLVTSGCGPGRKAQCRELGNATHAVMGQIETVYQSQIGGSAYDPAFERKMADAWEAAVGTVEAVELSDQELRAIRDDLAAAYQQAATTSRQAADLIPASGRLTIEAEQQVNALKQQSQAGIPPAINELNLYCVGG